MSVDPLSPDLQLIWDSFIDFEEFTRKPDTDLDIFLEIWKEKMTKVQSAGCQYSELLLGLKLMQKANLSRDSIVSVISKLNSSTLYSGSFIAQVVSNIKEEKDVNGSIENQNDVWPDKVRSNEYDEGISAEPEVKRNLTSCSKCPVVFFDVESLTKHQLQVHQDIEQDKDADSRKGERSSSGFLKCPICDKNFMLIDNLKKHIYNHNNPVPPPDEDSSFNPDWSDSSKLDADIKKDVSFMNVKIKKEIKSEVSDASDVKNGIAKASDITCEVCGRTFTTRNNLNSHMRTHIPALKCSICQKECKKYFQLKRHMESHKTTRDHKCTQCEKTFKRKDHLTQHISQTHGVKSEINADGKTVLVPRRKLPCEVCGKSVVEFNMKTHMKVHTTETFKCNLCPYKFTKLSSLELHMKTHDKGFQCNLCEKTFNYSALLRTHMETHRPTRDFICSFCGKKYKTKMTLRGHLKTHMKPKIPCHFCDKMFFAHASRKYHISKYHTGEKPYNCDFCDKGFYTSVKRANHMRTHTGEKPFPCRVCGKYFRDTYTLNRHLKRVHRDNKPWNAVPVDVST